MTPHGSITRSQARADTQPNESGPVFRVLIAYADLRAGKRAVQMLAEIGRKLEEGVTFEPSPWAFDLLTDAEWREFALLDAAKAEILVLATSNPVSIPEEIERWAATAIGRKRGGASAVVALFGPAEQPDPPDSERMNRLRAAAQDAGLDFFAPAVQGPLMAVKDQLSGAPRSPSRLPDFPNQG